MLRGYRFKQDSKKVDTYKLRISEETLKQLEYLTKRTGMNRAEILRYGVELQYDRHISAE